MKQRQNPFPGLNPFFEGYWSDVHTALLIQLRNLLGEELPDELRVRSEERILLSEPQNPDGVHHAHHADVAVSEDWSTGLPRLGLRRFKCPQV